MKMHDLGMKPPELHGPATTKDGKSYPTLYLSGAQADFLDGIKPGQTCRLMVEAEVERVSTSSEKKNASREVTLRLRRCGMKGLGRIGISTGRRCPSCSGAVSGAYCAACGANTEKE